MVPVSEVCLKSILPSVLFHPDDFEPIDDKVWYVSTNARQPMHNCTGISNSFVSLTPEFVSMSMVTSICSAP